MADASTHGRRPNAWRARFRWRSRRRRTQPPPNWRYSRWRRWRRPGLTVTAGSSPITPGRCSPLRCGRSRASEAGTALPAAPEASRRLASRRERRRDRLRHTRTRVARRRVQRNGMRHSLIDIWVSEERRLLRWRWNRRLGHDRRDRRTMRGARRSLPRCLRMSLDDRPSFQHLRRSLNERLRLRRGALRRQVNSLVRAAPVTLFLPVPVTPARPTAPFPWHPEAGRWWIFSGVNPWVTGTVQATGRV